MGKASVILSVLLTISISTNCVFAEKSIAQMYVKQWNEHLDKYEEACKLQEKGLEIISTNPDSAFDFLNNSSSMADAYNTFDEIYSNGNLHCGEGWSNITEADVERITRKMREVKKRSDCGMELAVAMSDYNETLEKLDHYLEMKRKGYSGKQVRVAYYAVFTSAQSAYNKLNKLVNFSIYAGEGDLINYAADRAKHIKTLIDLKDTGANLADISHEKKKLNSSPKQSPKNNRHKNNSKNRNRRPAKKGHIHRDILSCEPVREMGLDDGNHNENLNLIRYDIRFKFEPTAKYMKLSKELDKLLNFKGKYHCSVWGFPDSYIDCTFNSSKPDAIYVKVVQKRDTDSTTYDYINTSESKFRLGDIEHFKAPRGPRMIKHDGDVNMEIDALEVELSGEIVTATKKTIRKSNNRVSEKDTSKHDWIKIIAPQSQESAYWALKALLEEYYRIANQEQQINVRIAHQSLSGAVEAINSGQYSQALKYIRKVSSMLNRQPAELDYYSAIANYRLGNTIDAQNCIENALNGNDRYFEKSTCYQDAVTLASQIRMANSSKNVTGEYYRRGMESKFKKNYPEALKWLRKAAEKGVVDAQYELGLMYENSQGVNFDIEQVITWYLMAAKKGHVKAQYKTGKFYLLHDDGTAFDKRRQKALPWIKSSADNGYCVAQADYGNKLFEYRNYDLALKYLLKAMQQSSSKQELKRNFGQCCNNIGEIYTIKGEKSKAAIWYKKALAAYGNDSDHSRAIKNINRKLKLVSNIPALDLKWLDSYSKPCHCIESISVDRNSNTFIIGQTHDHLYTRKYNTAGQMLWSDKLEVKVDKAKVEKHSAVTVDNSDNVVICGNHWGKFWFWGRDYGSQAVVAKYSPAGDLMWDEHFGTKKDDESRSVTTDSKGNIFVCGKANGELGDSHIGKSDAFVMKFNHKGSEKWTTQFGTAAHDCCYDVATDRNGNIYACGHIEGPGCYEDSETGKGFIVKLNPSGKQEWIKRLDFDGQPNRCMSIAVDSCDNVYGCGFCVTSKDFEDDAYLVKYNSSGNLLWERYAKTRSSYTEFLDIAVDKNGNIYMSANSPEFNDSRKMLINKYSHDGTLLWTYRMDLDERLRNHWFTGITLDNKGNIFIGGRHPHGSFAGKLTEISK